MEQESAERTEIAMCVEARSNKVRAAQHPVRRRRRAQWTLPPLPASVFSVSSCELLDRPGYEEAALLGGPRHDLVIFLK